MPHRIAVGALVEDGGRLLMVHHVKRGAYDFWVAPGGGVMGDESLEDAARREAREESGIEIEPMRLAYIEQLMQPGLRHCKFWFHARAIGGTLGAAAPDAHREHIVDAAWLAPGDFEGRTVFPPFVVDRYWIEARAGGGPVHLPLRHMSFW